MYNMIMTRINVGSVNMARRYEIDDAQWEKIKPFLGNTPKKTGRPQALEWRSLDHAHRSSKA